jgi:hypothetical protein
MKNSIITYFTALLMLYSCSSPGYLQNKYKIPDYDKMDEAVFGSFIRIHLLTGYNVEGELIAIDNKQIIVLQEPARRCVQVSVSDVRKFTLHYARHKNYGWTIPVFAAASLFHGAFALISLPVNLITTISVTVSAQKAFTYSEKDMSLNKLKMFARFPQGIPSGVELSQIK